VEAIVTTVKPDPSPIIKSYIVLPAYNEATALSSLIPKIVQSLKASHRAFEVTVVNDGSSDETSQILSSLPPHYATREIRHEINQGYGFALKTGFLWVADHAKSEDAVVTMDADNTQDPVYIPALIATLEEGFDAVTASSVMEGGHVSGISWMRRSMSACINMMFQRVMGLPGVQTYTNGFRAYRVSALKTAHQKYRDHLIDEPGFPGGTELFLKIAGLGGKLAEIPFDLHYEQRGSESKIRLFSTIKRYLRLLRRGHAYVRNR
jgi:dolichol-phosphate mannosyltransferase